MLTLFNVQNTSRIETSFLWLKKENEWGGVGVGLVKHSFLYHPVDLLFFFFVWLSGFFFFYSHSRDIKYFANGYFFLGMGLLFSRQFDPENFVFDRNFGASFPC